MTITERITARLDALEAAARAATPGRWKLWGMQVLADQDGTSNVDTAMPVASTYCANEDGKPRTWDADHIALNDPAAVLRLVDGLRTISAMALWDQGERGNAAMDAVLTTLAAALDPVVADGEREVHE